MRLPASMIANLRPNRSWVPTAFAAKESGVNGLLPVGVESPNAITD